VAPFLKGTTYTFFVRQVAYSATSWKLDDFFAALFDFCFPADYISHQRKKLENLLQGQKLVKEYISELIEMFSIIRIIHEHTHVTTLWFSLRPTIQQGLWKDCLNPETSSWEDV
ncbi:hypothetical protein BDN71DRAFT_1350565, partial [Pleurotus eryngii]